MSGYDNMFSSFQTFTDEIYEKLLFIEVSIAQLIQAGELSSSGAREYIDDLQTYHFNKCNAFKEKISAIKFSRESDERPQLFYKVLLAQYHTNWYGIPEPDINDYCRSKHHIEDDDESPRKQICIGEKVDDCDIWPMCQPIKQVRLVVIDEPESDEIPAKRVKRA